ncbi:MAG: hypothetical protein ACRDNZ_17985 [Streptosporangiaceae bacterium]
MMPVADTLGLAGAEAAADVGAAAAAGALELADEPDPEAPLEAGALLPQAASSAAAAATPGATHHRLCI